MNGVEAMVNVLYDTDVLIDHLQGRQPISGRDDGAYSVVSRAELYSHKNADEAGIDRLLGVLKEVGLNRTIAEEAGRIRRSGRMKLPDAIIAATAIIDKRRLVTRNVRDYRDVPTLRLQRP